ncbi:hypothetical protein BK133_00860 [Paenibacillus sp. FSL H8-0548]|uniref:hypothetical protein n=1 Tax=Paenibacillus sp. FSL H8-0548 TaxID=1920422 RepID=UPI00096CD4B3|nr:hypothetical protein [Paenibacillus sp. FSL H8-0548]OMF38785.1 hypothetical protein BK133_00860 [Paenibacillus sp. FSL H8-0548]
MSQLEQDIQAQEDVVNQLDPRTAKHEEEQAKLDTLKAQLAAQTASEELFGEFENITIEDMTFTLRELCAGESQYQMLSTWLQMREGDRAQKQATIEASYKSQVEALADEVTELDKYRKQALEYSDKLADMELRRDAAAKELHNVKEENERLVADNAALRTQLESQSKPTSTNLNTNLAEIAKKLHDAKPAIYNKRWEDDLKRTSYLANLAENGEEISIKRLDIGQYRELSEDEASRFRAELEHQRAVEAAKLAEEAIQNISLVIPTLPSEGPGYELDEANEGVEMAERPVSRAEHEALAARVFQLEQSQRSVA